jgi:hypothetical protein
MATRYGRKLKNEVLASARYQFVRCSVSAMLLSRQSLTTIGTLNAVKVFVSAEKQFPIARREAAYVGSPTLFFVIILNWRPGRTTKVSPAKLLT